MSNWNRIEQYLQQCTGTSDPKILPQHCLTWRNKRSFLQHLKATETLCKMRQEKEVYCLGTHKRAWAVSLQKSRSELRITCRLHNRAHVGSSSFDSPHCLYLRITRVPACYILLHGPSVHTDVPAPCSRIPGYIQAANGAVAHNIWVILDFTHGVECTWQSPLTLAVWFIPNIIPSPLRQMQRYSAYFNRFGNSFILETYRKGRNITVWPTIQLSSGDEAMTVTQDSRPRGMSQVSSTPGWLCSREASSL